jgi:hypothetical protein
MEVPFSKGEDKEQGEQEHRKQGLQNANTQPTQRVSAKTVPARKTTPSGMARKKFELSRQARSSWG